MQAFFIILVLFLALFSSQNLLSPFSITLSALFSKPYLDRHPFVDQIGVVEIINKKIREKSQEKINAEIVVKGIILNGLGFVSPPLYGLSKFFVL